MQSPFLGHVMPGFTVGAVKGITGTHPGSGPRMATAAPAPCTSSGCTPFKTPAAVAPMTPFRDIGRFTPIRGWLSERTDHPPRSQERGRRNWARILSTVLFVLATLQLRGAFTQPVSHAGFGVTVLYYGGVVPFIAAWLAGAAAVWLLWRPASTAFFKPPGSAQALR